MAFDFKKEYKDFYMQKDKPAIITVPKMNYIAVRGKGDPNDETGDYNAAIGLLYGIAFTIKMSKKGDHRIDGYFDYVVTPLEGFWWQVAATTESNINAMTVQPPTEGRGHYPQGTTFGIDYSRKEDFNWISVIRLPDFVTKADFDWAVEEATKKKKTDFSKVEFLSYDEGLCVQCMHIGSYDDEPASVAKMHEFMEQQGYELDITYKRLHHEIYLSDARKVAPEKLKTVIRHPIKKK
ncbi:MAG: GyrI-like domain-containing protein [Lachnospiraceae bacterium]|nr:GyrI-like domain-containing protein [Lachnospiraceae bacterium]